MEFKTHTEPKSMHLIFKPNDIISPGLGWITVTALVHTLLQCFKHISKTISMQKIRQDNSKKTQMPLYRWAIIFHITLANVQAQVNKLCITPSQSQTPLAAHMSPIWVASWHERITLFWVGVKPILQQNNRLWSHHNNTWQHNSVTLSTCSRIWLCINVWFE